MSRRMLFCLQTRADWEQCRRAHNMLERRSPSNFSRPTARHRRRYGSPILSSAAAASFLLAIVLRASYERSVAAQPVGDDDGGGGGGASYPGCDGDIALIGDSLCDFDLNIDACGFDGGDCCELCFPYQFHCTSNNYRWLSLSFNSSVEQRTGKRIRAVPSA